MIKVLPTPKSDKETADEKQQRQDQSAANWWMVRLTFLLFTAALLQAIVYWIQAKRLRETIDKMDEISKSQGDDMKAYIAQATRSANAMEKVTTDIGVSAQAAKDAVDISQKSLVLSQRPKIVLRAFYFSETRGVGAVYYVANGVETGSLCGGQFYIVNCGGTRARLQEIWCNVFIVERLPMKRPYEGETGIVQEVILMPGQSTTFLFGLMQPLEAEIAGRIAREETSLYVLGRVGYIDDLGIYTDIPFCRRYDRMKDRFVPVEDRDYESGE